MTLSLRSLALPRLPLMLLLAAGLIGGGVVLAQIEGSDRGIAPVDSMSNYEIGGVAVDVTGRTADEARLGGWRVAQRKGWRMLWGRVNRRPENQAPGLPDSTLDAMVAGIVVEQEQIGPRRYIARLGVLFDRARTGRLLGGSGEIRRSAPMLVIPVMYSGGAATSFELRNEWQRAWARFRSGGSPIDYVRPVGTGIDPMLLNVSQTRRPVRAWWRLLLDQYGAADVIVPEVHVARQWPGGPVTAQFVARHGPDARVVDSFTLRGDALPALLDEGVKRMDISYADALRGGGLRIDDSLVIEEEVPEELLPEEDSVADAPVAGLTADFVVELETPDAATLGSAEASLRGAPGMRSAGVTSLALGGVSLVRLTFDGDLPALRTALAARGWQVSDTAGALRIRRAPPVAAPAPAATSAPPTPAP